MLSKEMPFRSRTTRKRSIFETTWLDVAADQSDPGAQRIHEGMNMIVNSLAELSASADLLEQRVKRPRTGKEDGLGDGGPGGGASFH